MKRMFIAACLLPSALMAEQSATSVKFSSTTSDGNYGVVVVAGESECPATRFMVLAGQTEALSKPLLAGESAVLPLGKGFEPGEHQLLASTLGCDAQIGQLRLVRIGGRSPGHVQSQILTW